MKRKPLIANSSSSNQNKISLLLPPPNENPTKILTATTFTSAVDLPYPIDWRRYPAEIKDPQDATHIFVKCKLHNKMNLKEIAQAGIKAAEQELASHGILSVRASPVTRRQCREQLRSHVRYSVVLDFVAHKNFILSGLVHEAAETVYKEIETNFPIAVADIIIGITDETRTFLSAEALVASGRTDHINNEHAFLVSPGGVAEAHTLRRRLDLAEQDKAAFAGMRMRRPNRKRTKYAPPPPPAWLVKVEEAKKQEKALEEQVALLCEPGRPYHLHRCGRCSKFDAFYNRAATSSVPPPSHSLPLSPMPNKKNPLLRPLSSTSVRSSVSGFEQHQILGRVKRDQPQTEFLERQMKEKAEKMNATDELSMMKSRRKSILQLANNNNNNNNAVHKQGSENENGTVLVASASSPSPAARDPHEEKNKAGVVVDAVTVSCEKKAEPEIEEETKKNTMKYDDIKDNNDTNYAAAIIDTTSTINKTSGDPSLDAMRAALNLASRRQRLKPMNMLQLKFSNTTNKSQNSGDEQ